MDTQQSKRGLFIGAFIFALLVFAVGVGMWVFNRNTDNRSQAAAEPVALVRIVSLKGDVNGLTHNVLFDISQMKAGTTVAEISTQIFVAKKEFTPPDQITTMPRPSVTSVKPSPYQRPPTPTPAPDVRVVTSTPPMPVVVTSSPVLGVSTEYNGKPVNMLPSGALVGPQPDQSPSGVVRNDVIARSEDGVLMVKGLGQFSKLQDLRITVGDSSKGYLLTLTAKVSVKDVQLQQAFSQPQALFAIMATETKAAVLAPVVETASIKGYLPGLKTLVELTKSNINKPTVTPSPTAKPPVVVSTCRTTKDCPKGYVCTPPRTPSCPPGKACAAVMASWQCTLMKVTPTIVRYPSKVIPSRPPVKVTGRQEIYIKSVQ